jgi:S1-C subfamily serine protease
MRMKFSLAIVAAAALIQTGCAHAQAQPEAPTPGSTREVTPTRDGFVVRGRPQPFYTGFSYSGAPTVLADGTVQFAEPPVISGILEGSPAHLAGLKVGDRIIQINGTDARNPTVLRARQDGQVFRMRIEREGALRDVTLVAAANPAAQQSQQ